jgi:hypothetical protein
MYISKDKMGKDNFRIISPSRWMWQVGSIIGVLGATEGAIAALFSMSAELRNSGLQISIGVILHENGFLFTSVLATGFIVSGILAILSGAIKLLSRLTGVSILFLGIALSALSILSGFSVGGYTMYGATFVLFSGIWLILASRLQPL